MHYVVAFGDDVTLIQDSSIKAQAVARSIYSLPADPSGVENTFQAVEWRRQSVQFVSLAAWQRETKASGAVDRRIGRRLFAARKHDSEMSESKRPCRCYRTVGRVGSSDGLYGVPASR